MLSSIHIYLQRPFPSRDPVPLNLLFVCAAVRAAGSTDPRVRGDLQRVHGGPAARHHRGHRGEQPQSPGCLPRHRILSLSSIFLNFLYAEDIVNKKI